MKEIIEILKEGDAHTEKIGRESEKMLNEAWNATIKYIAEIRAIENEYRYHRRVFS